MSEQNVETPAGYEEQWRDGWLYWRNDFTQGRWVRESEGKVIKALIARIAALEARLAAGGSND
jgi:hypothetical protein